LISSGQFLASLEAAGLNLIPVLSYRPANKRRKWLSKTHRDEKCPAVEKKHRSRGDEVKLEPGLHTWNL
jgi:hypothetical protein